MAIAEVPVEQSHHLRLGAKGGEINVLECQLPIQAEASYAWVAGAAIWAAAREVHNRWLTELLEMRARLERYTGAVAAPGRVSSLQC